VAQSHYDAEDIQVLEGLDPVRERPGMYIGSTGPRGLHHLVFEVVDNSVDEALAGHASSITVTINPDNSIKVVDDGRGIPVGIMKKYGKPAAEVVLTMLHAGGKFDNDSYKVSGGLHGVGVSVVNALSEILDLKIWREGREWSMRFQHGDAVAPLIDAGEAPIDPLRGTPRTGTEVTFLPSKETFTNTEFDFPTLEHRLRELAFLNSSVKLVLTDARGVAPKTVDMHYIGGLEEFVRWLDRSKTPLHKPTIALRAERDAADGATLSDEERRRLLSRAVQELTREWRASVRTRGEFEDLVVRGAPVNHRLHLAGVVAAAILSPLIVATPGLLLAYAIGMPEAPVVTGL